MANKSAAKLKVAEKKTEMTEEQKRKILDHEVENFKKIVPMNIDILINQCTRFDNLLAIHDSFARFEDGDHISIDEAKDIASTMAEMMQRGKEIVADITLDDILSEGFSNPMDELIPGNDPESWHEAVTQAIMFSAVRPFGEQVDSLVGQVIQKAAEIGYGQKETEDE